MEKPLIDQFIDMENEMQLYEKKFKDFPYWLYLRQGIYRGIAEQAHNNGKAFSQSSISFKMLPHTLVQLFFNKKYYANRYKGNYDFLFFCHPRRVYVNEKYQSIYTDCYANTLPESLTVERPYELGHKIPCETSHIMYLDHMFYSRGVKLKFFTRKNKKLREALRTDILQIVEEIHNRFGQRLEEEVILCRVEYFYARYCATKKYFSKLLRVIRPKVIVEVVHYNFENYVVTEVAKDLNIPVVELQHGLIGRYHIAYNYGNIKEAKILPDYLLTFSEFWSGSFRIPKEITEVRTTGFAYFENTLQMYPPKEKRNKIIFLSSGTIGNALHKIALDLYEQIKQSGVEYEIIYKLHPGEFIDWKSRYPQLVNSKIRVIDTPDINLYMLFSESIAQVGVYSTALFEGFGYNLQTFVLSHGEIEHVQALIDDGDAILVTKAEEILQGIANKHCGQASVEKYWEKDAYLKTKTFLNQLIQENM